MSLPPALVAVIVKVVDERPTVGVPEIVPLEARVNPAGSDGLTDHEVTVPPVLDAGNAVIAVPAVSASEFDV